ncbi:Helicase required for RNAi-mediated heterochromatin assembly 1 [Tolypocladium ophioglossoides CBS 100239]|uniref:Helicase required for RNAi-mediated heterochromatin assembly 1 n=1 Tax=Tolypocladium ophioglossoides (strain CBS 100239) TaxID=1163406 RepID=A0A0L0NCF1_TOLOC|nr:Helicase required for RNAi-mediated heterochromatin assembly 1 [Tolypocladium ophioglossoides CBS 100239]
MEWRSPAEIIARHVQHDCSDHLSVSGSCEQPSDWHLFPEVPLAAELMASQPPPLPECGDATSLVPKEEYLETQYRLHRYEATEMLRRAIVLYRQDPAMVEGENAFIYTEVRVQGYSLRKIGAACRISFSTAPGSQSDRLTPGTLVALSPRSDNFRSKCMVATIALNDGDSSPVVELFWANEGDAIIDPTLELVMLEPKGGYFEPLRHTMVGLQHAASFESRFDKYLFKPFMKHQTAEYVRETRTNKAVMPTAAKQLDPSQLDALKKSTSQELAIVQGPPGTGKTFTSIVMIESYVKTLQLCHQDKWGNNKPSEPVAPIIIAAQTNHPLDQLLDRCLTLGIGTITRLGGGCHEGLKEHTVFGLRQRSKAGRSNGKAEAAHKALSRYLREALGKGFPESFVQAEDLYDMDTITSKQYESLVDDEWEVDEADAAKGALHIWLDGYLEQTNRRRTSGKDAAADQPKPDQDRDFAPIEISRPACMLKAFQDRDGDYWLHRAKHLLARNEDLYQIMPADRGAVYCYLYMQVFDRVTTEVQGLLRQHKANCAELKMARFESNIRVIHDAGVQILGCTTTGLVKYRGMLAALKPRVLLIEEAAEAREANLAAALYPSIEQLVLVGDHQQLVPHVDMRELCLEPHRLNISLFERLVNIKVPYCSLRVQRRMIPSLREVVQVFYPNLEDHAIVKNPENRPPVPGMGGRNLWWFQHQWTQNHNGSSYSNWQEADMIVGFAKYLVQNGVSPGRITILAYYTAQVNLVKDKLQRNVYLAARDPEWSVRTIDGFQGEENDIILLSLVRGPDGCGRAMPGFLADENRADVATSRAKCGFYIFGNAQNVLQGNSRSRKTWEKVFKAFGKRTGSILPITCATHGNTTNISQPEDWHGVSAGECRSKCNEKCPNGHSCTAACHPRQCLKTTACGHKCGAFCGHACRCSRGGGGAKGKQTTQTVDTQAAKSKASTSPVSERSLAVNLRTRNSTGNTSPAKLGLLGARTKVGQAASSSGRIRYQTSDDLLEQGAHHFFAKCNRAMDVLYESDASISDSGGELLVSLTPPKALAGRWDLESVLRKDEALRQAQADERSSEPMAPTRIVETFRKTAVDGNGVRKTESTENIDDIFF